MGGMLEWFVWAAFGGVMLGDFMWSAWMPIRGVG